MSLFQKLTDLQVLSMRCGVQIHAYQEALHSNISLPQNIKNYNVLKSKLDALNSAFDHIPDPRKKALNPSK